ncbi:peptidylprolyl isomerase [Mesobaculum littorinae]|nr:peptidylprolyl isomerase [Mesobaculum littorinae]
MKRESGKRDVGRNFGRIIGAAAVAAALSGVPFGAGPLGIATPAQAQGMFAPVAEVDDRVITRWELDQRAKMLKLFRNPGDPQEGALEALIDERLQTREAERVGITVTEEQILAGEEEFAQRANLGREDFLAALAQAGVERESLRDFVTAGLLWREYVRERFRPRADISDSDVDKALTRLARDPAAGVRVLVSEIILPANNARNAARSEQLVGEIVTLDSQAAFSDAARRYSASPSREKGGQIDWLELSNLPPPIAQALLQSTEGTVAGPFPLPNALALFQLRDIDDTGQAAPTPKAVDYAVFTVAAGQGPEALAEGRRLAARVDTCGDLYGVAEGLPPQRLQRADPPTPFAQIPDDVKLQLARLDPNETTLSVGPDGALRLTMLCGRIFPQGENVTRDAVRSQLVSSQLQGMAEALVAELRANAYIRYY